MGIPGKKGKAGYAAFLREAGGKFIQKEKAMCDFCSEVFGPKDIQALTTNLKDAIERRILAPDDLVLPYLCEDCARKWGLIW